MAGKQSKWHVGQQVIVFTTGQRKLWTVTKVGRKWITAKENVPPQHWPREYRFDAETRKHEDGFAGRIAVDEADITRLLVADGLRDARARRVAQIEEAMRDGRWDYRKRMEKQPNSVLDLFEDALRAAGWWKN